MPRSTHGYEKIRPKNRKCALVQTMQTRRVSRDPRNKKRKNGKSYRQTATVSPVIVANKVSVT